MKELKTEVKERFVNDETESATIKWSLELKEGNMDKKFDREYVLNRFQEIRDFISHNFKFNSVTVMYYKTIEGETSVYEKFELITSNERTELLEDIKWMIYN